MIRKLSAITGALLLLASVASAQTEEGPVDSAEAPADSSQESADDEQSDPRVVRRLGDAAVVDPSTEWVPTFDANAGIAAQLSAASQALQDGRLLDPPNNNAHYYFDQAAAMSPDHPDVTAGRATLISRVAAEVRLLTVTDSAAAQALLDRLAPIADDSGLISSLQGPIDSQAELRTLTSQATEQLASGRLLEPVGDNADESLRAILAIAPDDPFALDGIAEIGLRLAQRAAGLAQSDPDAAATAMAAARQYLVDNPNQEASDVLDQAATAAADAAHELAQAALDSGNAEALEDAIMRFTGLAGPDDPRIGALQAGLDNIRWLEAHPPGTEFADTLSDGAGGPALIVIGAGEFRMGSPGRESGRNDNEGPQQEITFERSFALALMETSIADFARFVAATGYQTSAEAGEPTSVYNFDTGGFDRRTGPTFRDGYDGGPVDPSHPVLHVSHIDAVAYTDWLSAETGFIYRLPSEAEFEYALRAGSNGQYWWGSGSPDSPIENLSGARDPSGGDWSWEGGFSRYNDNFWGTAPVGSFSANPFGLFDMGGNVMEWTLDCSGPLSDKPADGSAVVNDYCDRRIVKGGSWASQPARSRSAVRLPIPAQQPNAIVGFRVLRQM